MRTERTPKAARARPLDRDGAALLRAVLDAPDDDEPRLVYADWLTEQGDPRGEFIVAQIELDRLGGDGATGPRADELRAREAHLLQKHKKKWTALAPGGRVTTTIGERTWVYGRPTKWEFRRGFAHTVAMDCEDLVANSALLFSREPVERVHLTRGSLAAVLDEAEGIERLRELDLSNFRLRPDDAEALFSTRRLGALRTLDLTKCRLASDGAKALARANPEHFPSLTTLILADASLSDRAVTTLAAAPLVAAVEELDLARNKFGAAGAMALARIPRTRWRRLYVTAARLGGEAGVALARSAAIAGVEELVLQAVSLDDDAVIALAARPLPSLRLLGLAYNALTDRAAKALRAAPWRAQLTSLDLDGNRASERPPEAPFS
jgi:uncharacterized protein (TIGR02996 family)